MLNKLVVSIVAANILTYGGINSASDLVVIDKRPLPLSGYALDVERPGDDGYRAIIHVDRYVYRHCNIGDNFDLSKQYCFKGDKNAK